MMEETLGFDLRPPVADDAEDKAKWDRVLARVKQHYVFWPSESVKPMADHIAYYFRGEAILKLPKHGTKFRSLVATVSGDTTWTVGNFIALVWKYARYEFKMSRAKYFTSFIQPDGFLWEEGDTRSVYSKAGFGTWRTEVKMLSTAGTRSGYGPDICINVLDSSLWHVNSKVHCCWDDSTKLVR